jgi:signal transduction histidine kinase
VAAPSQVEADTDETRVAELQAEVDALRDELRRAHRLATMGTMTAMVAHEFRNILMPLMNVAQVARRSPELAEKAIDRVASGSRRATSICSALLGLTEEREEPEPVRLSELVAETLEAMARPPQRDLIELTVDVPDDLTLTVRPVELQHVLLNLLINARKALLKRAGGRHLEISARRAKADVLLQVSDNGPGIPPEHQQRIFEPFYSVGGDEDEGYGLGLAVCRHITTSLGGDILVDSRPGEGTTFTLRLPA